MTSAVWLWILCGLFNYAYGQDAKAVTVPANLKSSVSSASDFFPYVIGDDVELTKIETEVFSYRKQGFATLYDPFDGKFMMYLYPPHFCETVFLCFSDTPQFTTKGVQGLNLQEACKSSLRFLPLEQMVYIFEGGTGKSYEYVLPVAFFEVKGDEKEQQFYLRSFENFDNEDLGSQRRVDLEFSIKNRTVLLLTSSQYCHSILLRVGGGPLPGRIVKIEPDVKLSDYFRLVTRSTDTSYIITNTMQGSTDKNKLRRSTLFDDIVNPRVSEEPCCPTVYDYSDFMESDSWLEAVVGKPIANLYVLDRPKRSEQQCRRNNEKFTSPFQSFRIEIGKNCDWMRICFDGGQTWCEHEGNSLALIFAHDVFIPTDSDQAIMFGIPFKQLRQFRINFLMNEPAITLEYGFTSSSYPAISHTMHLASYEKVGMDATKIQIHVVKDKYCHARILSDTGDTHYGNTRSAPVQCLNVRACTCFEY